MKEYKEVTFNANSLNSSSIEHPVDQMRNNFLSNTCQGFSPVCVCVCFRINSCETSTL